MAITVLLSAMAVPARAADPQPLAGDAVFDVSTWNVPASQRARLVVTGAATQAGTYAVCRVSAVETTGSVVSRVGVTCASDRSQGITATIASGGQSASQVVDYTRPAPVGRPSDFSIARLDGHGMRFAPCRPVPVRFNPGPAPPPFAMRGFRYALQQVREASGIPLRYKGTTSFVPRMGHQTTGTGLSVAFARYGRKAGRSDFPQLASPYVIGIGGWRSDPSRRWLASGYAVIERTKETSNEWDYVLTAMHEIGHAVGLDHASARGKQVMAPAVSAPGITWGRGDLRGLRLVGPRRSC